MIKMKCLVFLFFICIYIESLYAGESTLRFKDWNGKETFWAIYDSSFSYRMRGYLIIAPLSDKQTSYQAIYHCLLPSGQEEQLDYFLDVCELDSNMLLSKGVIGNSFGDEFIGYKKNTIEFRKEGNQMYILKNDGDDTKINAEGDTILGPLEFYAPWIEHYFKQGKKEIKIYFYDPAGYLCNKVTPIILKRQGTLQLNIPGKVVEGAGYEGDEWMFILGQDGKLAYMKSGIAPYFYIKVPDLTKANRQLKDYSNLGLRKPIEVLSDVYSAMVTGDIDLLNKSVDIEQVSSKLRVDDKILLEILLSGVIPAKTGINPTNFHQVLFLNKETINGDICEIAIAEIKNLGKFAGTQLPKDDNITFKFTFKRIHGVWLATNIKGLSSNDELNDMLVAYYNSKIYQLGSQNKIEEAIKEVQKATGYAVKNFGENHPSVALFLTSYAYLNKCKENYKESEEQYKRAIQIYKKHNIKDDNYLRCLYNLHLLYKEQGRNEEASMMMDEWKICNEKIEMDKKSSDKIDLSQVLDHK